MCGIAGYLGHDMPDLLPRMLARLEHRGPDDEGVHVEPGVGLGMRRLAIIDLASGRQPMASADGSAWIVFNGEIYNFRGLRAELEARGRVFRTRSDTEVILAAYEAWGEGCLERLHGMFALALWDGRRRRLFLARDRVGKKPLYYWQGGGRLVFASEIKALLCHPEVPRELDWDALHHYLAFGYTPRERSIFAGIAKLPPAHAATVVDGTLLLRRYWALPPGGACRERLTARDAAALARRELRDAVRRRLESDVPLGVFLSGGMDSSAIVACMREVTSGRIATYSVGFARAPSYDERPAARLVARHFQTDHHEEVLEPAVADVLPGIVGAFDEPFADSSAVATFVVAQSAGREVKVALSGIGGDETFAGYPRHVGVRLATSYRRLPRPLHVLGAAVVPRLVGARESSRPWGSRVRRFVAAAEGAQPAPYLAWTRYFSGDDLAALAAPALRGRLGGDVDGSVREAFADAGHDDPVDGALRADLVTYLPDDLLCMADRMGMAHSLEVRAPFCDHRLIEQTLRIAPRLKLPRLALKGLLKAAFADVLPPEILRRPKQGFMIPLAGWLRGELRPTLEDLLAPDRVFARGLFEPGVVSALVTAHLRRDSDHADRLWSLMMLELWTRRYLDERGAWSART
jgi:asparagine synthase (glutamine-hydrolysing)